MDEAVKMAKKSRNDDNKVEKKKLPVEKKLSVVQAKVAEPKPKMKTKEYEEILSKLQIELVKLQEWIKFKGIKLVIIF